MDYIMENLENMGLMLKAWIGFSLNFSNNFLQHFTQT